LAFTYCRAAPAAVIACACSTYNCLCFSARFACSKQAAVGQMLRCRLVAAVPAARTAVGLRHQSPPGLSSQPFALWLKCDLPGTLSLFCLLLRFVILCCRHLLLDVSSGHVSAFPHQVQFLMCSTCEAWMPHPQNFLKQTGSTVLSTYCPYYLQNGPTCCARLPVQLVSAVDRLHGSATCVACPLWHVNSSM
jgi:hypothetical protein